MHYLYAGNERIISMLDWFPFAAARAICGSPSLTALLSANLFAARCSLTLTRLMRVHDASGARHRFK